MQGSSTEPGHCHSCFLSTGAVFFWLSLSHSGRSQAWLVCEPPTPDTTMLATGALRTQSLNFIDLWFLIHRMSPPFPHLCFPFLSLCLFSLFFPTHRSPDGTLNQAEGEAKQSNMSEPAKLEVQFFACKYPLPSGSRGDGRHADGKQGFRAQTHLSPVIKVQFHAR